LRWSLLLSIFSIIFSCLFFLFNSPIFTVCSLIAFLDQMLLFIFSLLYSDLLPS
jgi:hypothetical protein